MPAYALTIFAGAFLLFLAQPLIGKYLLPWFGGGPGVWTTCMLFFQVALLAGYGYAHLASRRLRPRTQAVLHLVLVAAALALLPIIPGDLWKPRSGEHPVLRILAILAASLGLPYFVLAATSPLLQQWFARAYPGRSPYRLYALSNAGSLLALAGYPFYFESHFTRRAQAGVWGWGLGVYALGCALCAAKLWRAAGPDRPPAEVPESAEAGAAPSLLVPGAARRDGAPYQGTRGPCAEERAPCPPPSLLVRLLWLLLPACASVLLLATTNKLCLDVASVPFLWVLPLGVYLLSFIVCFDSPRWYARFPFTVALVAAMGGYCWALAHGSDATVRNQVAVYCGALFVCCMVCHGELYRLRPAVSRLSEFYLMIAAGGAAGGLFVAVGCPLFFKGYYELHCGMLLCGMLFLAACTRDESGAAPQGEIPEAGRAGSRVLRFLGSALQGDAWAWIACALAILGFAGIDRLVARVAGHEPAGLHGLSAGTRAGLWAVVALLATGWVARGKHRDFRHWHLLACCWLAVGWLALLHFVWKDGARLQTDVIYRWRDFYGVLTVFEHERNDPGSQNRVLLHGRITHGMQFLDPARVGWATTYYGEKSGVGLALEALPEGPRRIGLVGLGTGTLAAYGRAGDYLRIYELNPQVEHLARSLFEYLGNCPARVEIAPGDARLSLEREPSQQFDLLALDAFSSDSIPVHLLTREAFALYGRHLKPNGVLAVHISNHYLDLEPVVANLARHFGYKAALISYEEEDKTWWLYSSTWMLLTRDEGFLAQPAIAEGAYALDRKKSRVPLWTDDFTSLFQILK